MFSVEKQQLCGVCCQIMLLFLALQQLTFSYLKVLQNLAESPFPLFFWPHCSRFVDMPFLSFLLLFLFIFSKLDRLLLRIRAVRLLLAHSWVSARRLCICTCHFAFASELLVSVLAVDLGALVGLAVGPVVLDLAVWALVVSGPVVDLAVFVLVGVLVVFDLVVDLVVFDLAEGLVVFVLVVDLAVFDLAVDLGVLVPVAFVPVADLAVFVLAEVLVAFDLVVALVVFVLAEVLVAFDLVVELVVFVLAEDLAASVPVVEPGVAVLVVDLVVFVLAGAVDLVVLVPAEDLVVLGLLAKLVVVVAVLAVESLDLAAFAVAPCQWQLPGAPRPVPWHLPTCSSHSPELSSLLLLRLPCLDRQVPL